MQGSSGISGFLCVDKPNGWTSADVVAALKGAFYKTCAQKVRIGHMGTLDPAATGVLVVAVGKATRLFDLLMSKTKGYVCSMAFGEETDTLDSEGTVTESTEVFPAYGNVKEAVGTFIGRIEQYPPIYSAKSVDGVKAYKLARAGKSVQVKPVQVEIKTIEILTVNDRKDADDDEKVKTLSLKVECGGGTYIRSLCRDIARKCGSLATMTSLRRTYSGDFSLASAHSIEQLRLAPSGYLMPITKALEGVMPIQELDKRYIKRFTNGASVPSERKGDLLVTIDGREYAVAHCENGEMKAAINLWM